MTPAGIEPATFRFVAQNLNHYATAVPCDRLYSRVLMCRRHIPSKSVSESVVSTSRLHGAVPVPGPIADQSAN